MEYLYGKLKTLERAEAPLSEAERLGASGGPLLDWYRKNRRPLPWRENTDPYRVWISEIMLQQTRVEAVKPYFARFTEALPDIAALASVEEETLLKLWEGLGYYTRARNLKKAAEGIMENHGGRMPASYGEILALPGIGSYTAGAISSISFGIPEPAVDGNVLRVLARLFADPEDIKKASVKKRYEGLLREQLQKEMARRRGAPEEDGAEGCEGLTRREECGGTAVVGGPGEWNQAWIELGALVCIPGGQPHCLDCPLESLCLARREGRQEEFPVRSRKKPRRIEERTVFVIEWEDRAAIRKRSGRGLLASLYEFPNVEGHLAKEELPGALGLLPEDIAAAEELPPAVHIFSHVEWHMIGYRVRLARENTELFKMVQKEEIFSKYPLPNAFGVYTRALM